jgi:HEAT repeat protein
VVAWGWPTGSPVVVPVAPGADSAAPDDAAVQLAAPAPRPAPVAGEPASAPPGARALLDRVRDPAVPLAERQRAIAAAARDLPPDEAVAQLVALADAGVHLGPFAVAELGRHRGRPAADRWLAAHRGDGDPAIAAAVVRALGSPGAAPDVPAIAAAMLANRRRADGHEDVVLAAAVEVLGRSGDPAAIPVLDRELRETVGPVLQHDYGSLVVGAIGAIGHADGAPPLAAYRRRLAAELAGEAGNAFGRTYLARKIAEVDRVIDELKE